MQDKILHNVGNILKALKLHYNFKTNLEFEQFLGINEGILSVWKSRNRIADESVIITKCKGLRYEWLTTGQGPMFSSEAPDTVSITANINNTIVSEPHQDYISMPVRALAGAGEPCDLQQLEPIGYITVHKDLDGPNIQVVEIRGKSMEPTIVNGARVGVDTADKNIISGELYACYIPHEGIVVKRINMAPDLVIIKSDNQSFEDHSVMIDRINWDTFIQGRVKWVLQKYT